MKVYLVGGAVRDKLLNIPNQDYDYVVVGSTVEEMLSRGFHQVGNSFPVFLEPKTKDEYALARKEKKEGHGYNGFCFDFSPDITLEEDLVRRDLTINAIAEDENGNIIDPCGGQEDLKNRILRHIGPSFSEDPLRVLRVARFAARFHHIGFSIAPETMELMKTMVKQGEIDFLTPERIFLEFENVLHKGALDVFVRILRECGALKVIFPELDALYGIPARKHWHPEVDTGIHMELCLKYACEHNYQPIEKFALFCHDFGKALSDKNLLPSHTNHGKKGVPLIENFCDRLRIPNHYRKVAKLVASEHSFVHLALYKTEDQLLQLRIRHLPGEGDRDLSGQGGSVHVPRFPQGEGGRILQCHRREQPQLADRAQRLAGGAADQQVRPEADAYPQPVRYPGRLRREDPGSQAFHAGAQHKEDGRQQPRLPGGVRPLRGADDRSRAGRPDAGLHHARRDERRG